MATETATGFDISNAAHGNVEESKLAKQDLATLDVSKLTPLSPEVAQPFFFRCLSPFLTWCWRCEQVISRQATINIGTWHVVQRTASLWRPAFFSPGSQLAHQAPLDTWPTARALWCAPSRP